MSPASFQDFGTPEQPAELGPSFKLAGEVFHAVAEAPAGVLADVAASLEQLPNGDIRFRQVSLLSFFRGVLVEAPHTVDGTPDGDPCGRELDRFDDLVRRKDVIIPLETLGKIYMWLASELTGRPTGPPTT